MNTHTTTSSAHLTSLWTSFRKSNLFIIIMAVSMKLRRKHFVDTFGIIETEIWRLMTNYHRSMRYVKQAAYKKDNYVLYPLDIVMIDQNQPAIVSIDQRKTDITQFNAEEEKKEAVSDDEHGVVFELARDNRRRIYLAGSELEERAKLIISGAQLNVDRLFSPYIQKLEMIHGKMVNYVDELLVCNECGTNCRLKHGAYDIYGTFYCDHCWDNYYDSLCV